MTTCHMARESKFDTCVYLEPTLVYTVTAMLLARGLYGNPGYRGVVLVTGGSLNAFPPNSQSLHRVCAAEYKWIADTERRILSIFGGRPSPQDVL